MIPAGPGGLARRLRQPAVAQWLAAAVLVGLSCLLLPDRVAALSTLFPDVITSVSLPLRLLFTTHALLPLFVCGSLVALVAPGVLLALAFGREDDFSTLVLKGLLLTFPVYGSLFVLLHVLTDGPVRPELVRWSSALVVAGCATLCWRRVRRGTARIAWSSVDRRRLLQTLAGVLIATWLLGGKLLLENFDGDGYEAFEFGRGLFFEPMPRWLLGGSQAMGFHATFLLFAYPNAWYTALLGPVEAAARLPFVLYLVLLFHALVVVIEHDGTRRLRTPEELALWCGVALFGLVAVFNTSWNPYYADISEPAAPDTLALVCVLTAAAFLCAARTGWFLAAAACAHLSSPGSVVLLAAFGAALGATDAWHRAVRVRAVAVFVALVIAYAALYDWVYVQLYLGVGGTELSTQGLLARLRYIRLSEPTRLAFLLVPSGLLPALSLLYWTRQDAVARALTLTTAGYFLLMYVRAFVPSHNFIPVFALPLAVFWRLYLAAPTRAQSRLLPAVVIGTLLAAWVSLPPRFDLSRKVGDVGARTAYLVGDLDENYAVAARHARILRHVIRRTSDLADPASEWGTSMQTWMFYALRAPASRPPDYVVQDATLAPPAEFEKIAEEAGVAAYVRDLERWSRDRFTAPPTPSRSWLYHVPQRLKFVHMAGEHYATDLADFVPDWLRARLGRQPR